MEGADLLQGLAEQAAAFCAMPVVAALRALQVVVAACFGAELRDDVEQAVAEYRMAYMELDIPVTVKNHAIFVHVAPFCRARGQGLALFSEQASEAVHSDFEVTWANYLVAPSNPAHPSQLVRAMEAYNCRHL